VPKIFVLESIDKKKLAIDCILFFSLFLACLKFAFFLDKVIDITLGDESVYLNIGINFLRDRSTSGPFPLYSSWYYLLSSIKRTL